MACGVGYEAALLRGHGATAMRVGIAGSHPVTKAEPCRGTAFSNPLGACNLYLVGVRLLESME